MKKPKVEERRSKIWIYDKSPFSSSYDNVIFFGGTEFQNDFFENSSLLNLIYYNDTYAQIKKSGNIIVEGRIEKFENASYMRFQNAGRMFYAFVIDSRYINENATELMFEIDTWNTYSEEIINSNVIMNSYVEQATLKKSFGIYNSRQGFNTGTKIPAQIDNIDIGLQWLIFVMKPSVQINENDNIKRVNYVGTFKSFRYFAVPLYKDGTQTFPFKKGNVLVDPIRTEELMNKATNLFSDGVNTVNQGINVYSTKDCGIDWRFTNAGGLTNVVEILSDIIDLKPIGGTGIIDPGGNIPENGTGIGGTGTQLAVFPMHYINCTQSPYTNQYSHAGSLAGDFAGKTERYPYYAPFDCQCRYVRDDNMGTVVWSSLNPVMCADGTTSYVSFVVGHDWDWAENTVGTIKRKGELIGHTGSYGISTGDHLHIECGKWDFKEGDSPWYRNPAGNNSYPNPAQLYDVFSAADNTTKEIFEIVNSGNMPWRQIIDYDDNTFNEPEGLDDVQKRAFYVFSYLKNKTNWTTESIFGILGNISYENSQFLPDTWAGNGDGGYGLVQWTPGTDKIIAWANANGKDPALMDTQLEYLIYERENYKQFAPSSAYNWTWDDFVKTTSIDDAAASFLYCYERPADQSDTVRANRIKAAKDWATLFTGYEDNPYLPETPVTNTYEYPVLLELRDVTPKKHFIEISNPLIKLEYLIREQLTDSKNFEPQIMNSEFCNIKLFDMYGNSYNYLPELFNTNTTDEYKLLIMGTSGDSNHVHFTLNNYMDNFMKLNTSNYDYFEPTHGFMDNNPRDITIISEATATFMQANKNQYRAQMQTFNENKNILSQQIELNNRDTELTNEQASYNAQMAIVQSGFDVGFGAIGFLGAGASFAASSFTPAGSISSGAVSSGGGGLSDVFGSAQGLTNSIINLRRAQQEQEFTTQRNSMRSQQNSLNNMSAKVALNQTIRAYNASLKDLNNQPSSILNNGSEMVFQNGYNLDDLYIAYEIPTYEILNNINKYLYMFGTIINQFSNNIRQYLYYRFYFNYIKTTDLNIVGVNINLNHLNAFKSIFNSGVRIWKYYNITINDKNFDDTYLDFTVENYDM